MPINIETVKTNLYAWAVANLPTGYPVTMYYENAPRPETDYVTLNIINYVMIGQDYTPRPQDSPGNVEQVGDREFTVQLQAYGGNVFDILESLRFSLQKQTVLDTLATNGIVFVQQFPIQDITELVNSRFEKRTTMDILFRIGQTYGDVLGSIDTVEIQEEFLQGNVVVITENVTVTIDP